MMLEFCSGGAMDDIILGKIFINIFKTIMTSFMNKKFVAVTL